MNEALQIKANPWAEQVKGKRNIVMLYPKTGMDVGGATVAPPHSLLAAAAPMDHAGYDIKIIDMRRDSDWKASMEAVVSEESLFVGISAMTGTQVHFAILMAEFARKLTKGKVPIVWGGAHASILPEQTLEHALVDMVVLAEGEVTGLELANALVSGAPLSQVPGLGFKKDGKLTLNESAAMVDVDELLPVPWHLIDVESYISPDNYFLKDSPRTLDIGQTSRGCPYKCGFCASSSILYKRWRAMSIDRAMKAIEEPVRKFNLTGVWIRDDEFYVNSKRAYAVCERIQNSDLNIQWYSTGMRVNDFLRAKPEQLEMLKRSGGTIMKFGAESGSDRILKLIQKGIVAEQTLEANQRCKEFGIIPAFSFIIGFPTETFEEINQTIDFAFRLKKENPDAQLETFATYTAFPGTPMYPLALEYGLRPPKTLDGWKDWILDDYDETGDKLPWFSEEEREWIGNISYMSILANAIDGIGRGIKSDMWRNLFSKGLIPIKGYYGHQLKAHRYKFVPELKIARAIRKKVFYRSEETVQ
ncbi:MAG: hypothetical protein A2527_02130 [Candidatus Lambdaproteobacteria bacterium RIFOXYD2_FULL_50_16]|uniref:Uncharacterized protein n=1 Tax=Candidatus Lambdaproteobacteria bacterium RIFOXYD2_FULL_50_16 TaxID=1817772 RepID=A0A1F6GE54_9PROT|nr:MAG: hypothetical protein A2527_02130 [Candidatus Lambdaproteobacteria bacterium RIFOXYD2_FULL_50_16]